MKTVRLRLVILSIVSLCLSSCSGTMPAQITSLNVGCKTKDVEISDERVELNGEERWTAKCGGRTYSCSYLPESGSDCYELDE